RVRREIIIWSRLQHESIVPLFGTVCRLGNYDVTGIVSAWMAHGNLSDYLVNQLLTIFERIQILCEVANGIEYLHSLNIIHGDISGSNILINEKRHACLGDFGISSIKAEFEGTSYWSSTIGGAIRWRAPELLPSLTSDVYNFEPDLTWRCDIYSFGNVMLQVLSNKIPYDYISRNEYVLIELFRRHPPRRPESRILSDEYWKFIKYCWGDAPKSRPLAKDLYTSILDLRDDT
ncbi:kinase-like protein, partial [Athelia psychrophila]